MSENVNVISQEQIDATVKRIEELGRAKADLEMKNNEVDVHESDLVAIEKTCGVDSNDYNTKKLILNVSLEAKAELEKKVAELSFKKSELKPVLDAVIDQFQKSLRSETDTVYSIEFGECEKDKEGNAVTPCSNARKNFKQVMEYLNKDVEWTPSSVPGLMMLVTNMDENRPWVQDGKFDGVLKLRSANILVLWNSLIKNLSGKGYYSAKTFISLWTSIGKPLSDAVNKVNEGHAETRKIGETLDKIQTAYDDAESDIDDSDVESISAEVNPEV